MAHSYTPGLRVTEHTKLERRRVLPLKGEVVVSEGDSVTRSDIVARTDLPGDVTTVNVVNRLGIEPSMVKDHMLKNVGDPVEKDDVIGETRPLIKWFKSEVKSPVAGVVETISDVTGQVIIRHPPRPVEVTAYVDGTITEVLPGDGVVVETKGAFVQGIFGVGGETWGELDAIVDSHDEAATAGHVSPEHKGKILLAGRIATLELIRKAIDVGAAGLIVGGINAEDLRQLLGYDLGVAITGTEDIGCTIIVTEGFGEIAMASRTFSILKACCNGRTASINGATQIRAGVMRPEIIVRGEAPEAETAAQRAESGLEIGDTIRIIREPYFGKLGTVSGLPSELTIVESETKVRVLELEFPDDTKAIVPRANVESITM